MKIITRIILTLTLLCGLLTVDCKLTYAAIPHLINYQGRLTDSGGIPLNGSYALTFRIYDAETAGNLLWEETHSGVVIQKGIFSVLLGSVTALNLPFDKPYFLEIKVGGEVMSPRQRITSAGYAIRAEKAEMALKAEESEKAKAAIGSENIFPSSGNVGIGTVVPNAKLDVKGNILSDGKKVLTSECSVCYQKWADGDWGQCGPPYSSTPVCASVGSWTEAHRDDTDGRGGGCYQRWMISCP